MSGALVQSTSFPSSVADARHGQLKGSGKTKRTVTMMCTLQACPPRMGSLSSLRGSTAFQRSCTVAAANPLQRGRARRGRATTKAVHERFTEKAIAVIMLAQDELRQLGHNILGTEQILLGLIGEGTGIAARVLESNGINLEDARVEVEKIIGRGTEIVSLEIPFTPRAQRVLTFSLEEARNLGQKYIGPEHLLLGLLREGEGVAVRVLENLGADPSNIREQVIRMIGEDT